jgi:hypothetical protein
MYAEKVQELLSVAVKAGGAEIWEKRQVTTEQGDPIHQIALFCSNEADILGRCLPYTTISRECACR